ncbi:MAG: hypothetical protein GWN53_19660 [Gammaproteobacteria bacterium]|nr:hypothetical protein [Gammaproteobacteria bacterium]
MRYPRHPSQPNAGNLPPMPAMGPSDLHPSAHNPNYDVYNMSRGRYLGALGAQGGGSAPEAQSADGRSQQYMSSLERGMKDYPEELDYLSEVDDVQGNGVFDAPGTHGNIHPDSGVFSDRESLPGYVARERPFAPSEVLDVNTGKPVVFVPGNAFYLDPRTPWVMDELKLYEPGMPSTGGQGVAQRSTVVPDQPGWPVSGVGAAEQRKKTTNMVIMAALGGLSIGLVAGIVSKR